MIRTKPWDAAEHIGSPEMAAAYVGAAIEDGDPALTAAALADTERAGYPIAIKHSDTYKAPMITGAQIRAARALLGWTTQRLADASGVHYATLSRAEQGDGIPNMRAQTLASVQMTLEKAGCLFFDGPYSGDGGPGVRLR